MRATPEMIAAAWATWKARGGQKLGPGPAFVEAINAALALLPGEPVAYQLVFEDGFGLTVLYTKEEAEKFCKCSDMPTNIRPVYAALAAIKGDKS